MYTHTWSIGSDIPEGPKHIAIISEKPYDRLNSWRIPQVYTKYAQRNIILLCSNAKVKKQHDMLVL